MFKKQRYPIWTTKYPEIILEMNNFLKKNNHSLLCSHSKKYWENPQLHKNLYGWIKIGCAAARKKFMKKKHLPWKVRFSQQG